MLHEENQSLKEINKRCSDSHLRMRNRLERLHKDWDKLWEICKDKGMTEEEIIVEMERWCGMKCLMNCIFMYYINVDGFTCMISKKNPPWGKTCPYENRTVTELNMEWNYTGDDVNDW